VRTLCTRRYTENVNWRLSYCDLDTVYCYLTQSFTSLSQGKPVIPPWTGGIQCHGWQAFDVQHEGTRCVPYILCITMSVGAMEKPAHARQISFMFDIEQPAPCL